MNKKYNLKLDLQFRCNNSVMKFNQFDNNTSDFFMRITNGGKLVNIEKAIVVLAVIKPNGKVDSQFVEVENGVVYANLKPSMKDEIGIYTARAMLILENEKVVTDTISYEVEEDKVFSLLNDSVEATEEFTLLTDMLSRLSTIEISEEQRMINEAERILAEENRKIEEAKRVEAELIRQHEEADRSKYDATRESNENIRKQNESIRLANETNRIDEEAKRVEEENKRKLAEEERNANYNFMTEDEERRRSEANAHKEAEVLRVQAETNRVNEEAKRRTTEQARVSAENTRVSNENTRKSNEIFRENNETQRIEAETQRQNRYNSFITEAEANANNFENYTNNAKVKEEERKANELDRKSQEAKRVSNEVERISNENTRKANEVVREKNEASRQNVFENKVNEVDEKIIELNTTKDNFISSVNTKVDNKISEIEVAKSDMTTTVSNKIDEVENRFNALTSKQQQDAEVVDARDGEVSLKARLDRDIEKAKEIYTPIEGSYISTDSSSGYLKDVEILGNTIQDASNLADIRSVGDKVEGQELYEIPVLSRGKNLFDGLWESGTIDQNTGSLNADLNMIRSLNYIEVLPNTNYIASSSVLTKGVVWHSYDENYKFIEGVANKGLTYYTTPNNAKYIKVRTFLGDNNVISLTCPLQLEEGTVATPYEPYQEDKLTILSPVQLEKVGDVRDRIIEKDGVLGVEKNVGEFKLENLNIHTINTLDVTYRVVLTSKLNIKTPCNYGFGTSLCNMLPFVQGEYYTRDEEHYYLEDTGGGFLFIDKNKFDGTKEGLNKYLKGKGYIIKYQLSTPQFIPLPHDQQVKLRTFAGKTNISFLTEIEGTIKAQVPKSLGATVNIHTEQINNLNKELDRVKKLEESTVSTVETESDFTTVEATSNGYFEDVKLEGKTLVNLIKSKLVTRTANTNDSTDMGKVRLIKDNTYTVIYKLNKASTGGKSSLGYYNESYWLHESVWEGLNYSSGTKMYTFKARVSGDIPFRWWTNNSTTDVEVTDFIILEGDHTQNPPSYFEGLKSVGQSTSEDGADEIVVSSVKGDGNLFDVNNFIEKQYVNANGGITQHNQCVNSNTICVEENKAYHISLDETNIRIDRVAFFDINMNCISVISGVKEFTTPLKCKYIIVGIHPLVWQGDGAISYYKNANLMINKGTTPISYTPHQADKKQLLFYNTETQTWEKPILRQWDSIEKHSDGKYYYHVRSIEEDYTEGDETVSDYITDMTTTVKPLAEEKVYECTNIDLITYANETNYIVESGAITPKSTLKVHNNISNVVSLLQKKVSLLESNITNYMITQNRMQLASTYSADSVTFKVDYALCSEETEEYNEDLYNLILHNILVGKDNYDYDKMFTMILDYASWNQISWEQFDILVGLMDMQHNPPIEETPTDDEIVEEIPNEIM